MCRKLLISALMGVLAGVVVNGGMLVGKRWAGEVRASSSLVKSSQADFVAGRFEYNEIDVGSTVGEIKLQANLGVWDGSSSPADIGTYNYTATPMVKVGRFVYMLRNRAVGPLMRYDLDSREWKEMAFPPNGYYEVADLTTNGTDTIYAFAARFSASIPTLSQKYFLKYDIATDTWTYLSQPPGELRTGAALEYVAGVGGTDFIYAIQGSDKYTFWKYNVGADSWSAISNSTYYCWQGYCDMQYDGSRYLYLSTYWQNPDRLYRYDTQLGTWTYWNYPIDGAVASYPGHLAMLGNTLLSVRGGGTTQMYKFDIGTTTMSTVSVVPTSYSAMVTIAEENKVLVYAGVTGFYYYYPATNTWSDPLVPNVPVYGNYTNMAMVGDTSGNVYYCRGANTQVCYMYNTNIGGTWAALPTTPATIGQQGGSLAWLNGHLYLSRGTNGNTVYKYNTNNGVGGTWTTLSASPVSTITTGSAMVGVGSSTLYALQGGGATGFYKYNVTLGTWTTQAVVPEVVYYGSALVAAGDYVYALTGYQKGTFVRYDQTANSWTRMKSLPEGVFYGGGMVYDGNDAFYATVGGTNEQFGRRFYKYTISTDSWSRVADTPEFISNGGGIAWANGSAWVVPGNYKYNFWKYTPVGADSYRRSGSWYSQPYDLTGVSSWSTFEVSETKPAGTDIKYYSRSSAGGNLWNSWTEITVGGTIPSAAARYVQIRADLSGDGTATPTVGSMTINYNGDETAPSLAGLVVNGYASNGGVGITSGESYTYPNPYFVFSGATDTLTGIDGYYVYYGETAAGDPVMLGNYQVGTSYTVATPMSVGSTYYLRIKTKDKAGNVSTAVTGFTYGYSGISPSTSLVIDTQGEFEAGSFESLEASTSAWWNTGYLYRQPLTVTNSGSTAINIGDFIGVSGVGTSALVAAGKMQSDGDDLRIVYWDGTDWVEAPRGWENLNTAATKIFFQSQSKIGVGATDVGYYMYYGNATTTDGGSLSVFYDDFEDNSLDGSKWVTNSGYGTIAETSGQLRYTGRTSGNSGVSTQVRSNSAISGDFTMNAKVYLVNNQGGNFSGGLFMGSYDDSTPANALGTLEAFNYNGPIYAYNKLGVGYSYASNVGVGNTYVKASWVDIKVTRQGDNWNFFKNGEGLGGKYGLYSGDIYVNTLRYWKESLGTSWQGDMYIEEIYFNSKVGVGVTANLGSEEGVVATTAANLKLNHLKNGSWAGYQLPPLPRDARFYYGAMGYANNSLYVLPGRNSQVLYKLDLGATAWVVQAPPPATIGNNGGATMVYDGVDSFYVTRGIGTTAFYKYTMAAGTTGSWSSNGLTPPPLVFYAGAVGVRVGSDTIYYLPGNSQLDFLKYTISTNTWTSMSSAPWGISTGAGLAYDGNDTIWMVVGAGSVAFGKYTISTNSWSTDVPLPPHPMGAAQNDLVYSNGVLYNFGYLQYGQGITDKRYVWQYNVATSKWSEVATETDFWSDIGAAAYDGSRYIYLVQGYSSSDSGTRSVYRFDTVTKKFLPETPTLPKVKILTNGDAEYIYHQPTSPPPSMVFDGEDTIYHVHGNGVNGYANKYTVSTKTWSRIAPIPCYWGSGGLSYVGGYVYAACGATTQYFYRYDPLMDRWEQKANTPATIAASGNQGMVAVGEDTLYLVRGIGTTTMYQYTISTDTWGIGSTSIPAVIGSNWGASLTSDGSGALYLVAGNAGSLLFKYDLVSQTWSRKAGLTNMVYNAGGSIYYDGKIYAIAGDAMKKFYIYDVASDRWTEGPDMLSEVNVGAGIVKGPGATAYALNGWYDMAFRKLNLPTTSTSYAYRGVWTSPNYDLGNPYVLAGISANVASPSATATTIETRTSADAAAWSDWAVATGMKNISGGTQTYNVVSTANKYLQIRVTLESEESAATPVLSGLRVDYYNDQTDPINPDTLVAHNSSVGVTDLVTDAWYNYANPWFMWSGATDGSGSGVAGYYVYFGTDVGGTSTNYQVGTTYVASISSDGEYYLRIQTKDNAGNISDPWEAFHYKYDGTAPGAPSSVAADPRGYTATNSFTMFWTASSDVGASSGLAGYKYKTGVGTGAYSADQLTTSTTLSAVPAYQTGSNTFYVKAVDNAGNESDYTSTTYYYNGSAPSPPTNLSVGESYSTSNSFSFSWELPLSYTGSISEYRYSVNSLPTATNYTATVGTSLAAGAYATLKGKNIFYVVAVDDAANVNYDAYSSVEFTADTSAPGIPTGVETFDNSIRATKQYKVGLTWDAPADLGTGFAGYAIYASKTATSCTTSFSGFTLAGTTAGTTYVVADIGGTALTSSTYYFCVKAYDSTNQYSAVSSTVSLLPTGKWLTAPGLSSGPTSTVKTKSAVIVWVTDRASNSFVKYGTSSGTYGNEVGSSTQSTSHSISLSNLTPGTKYYYKVLWTDEDGNQGTSSEYNFTTTAAPSISSVTVSDIGLYAAYIKFTIKNASSAVLQYGKTTSYGATVTISTSTAESTYIQRLDNLEDGTIYHFRIVGKDEEANEFVGDDYTFTTLPVPEVSAVKIQQVRGASTATIRLTWKSNTEVTSVVSFYPEGRAEMTRDQITLDMSLAHEMIIEGLLDDSDYVFVVKGKDVAGNSVAASTNKFKTSTDLRSPLISDLRVEPTVVGVGEEARAQITIFWNTDELASSQIEYGSGTGSDYPNKTQEDGKLNSNHVVIIPDLKPQSVYHLRVVTKDRVGNASYSYDNVVITPKATRAALDLVVESLSKSFGFFGSLGEVMK